MFGGRFVEWLSLPMALGLQALILTGPSAWAQTGWPNQAGSKVFASPATADLDGDGLHEVIVPSVSGGVYVWHNDGSPVSGWPRSSTHEFRASAAVGNLDYDAELELVVCSSDRIHGATTENYVYSYESDGTLRSGFPKSITGRRLVGTPAIGNIDGATDSLPEIVLLAGDANLYAWHADGSTVSGYPKSVGGIVEATGNLILMSSPALADVDNDGLMEVFVGTTGGNLAFYNGSNSATASAHNWVLSSPAVGDLDGDGTYEVVVGSGDGNVYVWHASNSPSSATLTSATGWPQQTPGVVYSSPALADIDGATDGNLEIVCGSYDGKVYVWRRDGTLLPGWPQETRRSVLGSPAVADIDGDGKAEIIVGSMGNNVYIWNDDGTLLSGWPKTLRTDIYSSPAVVDLDNDDEISVIIASFDGLVYQWELGFDTSGSSYSRGWPMFGYNAARSAWIEP